MHHTDLSTKLLGHPYSLLHPKSNRSTDTPSQYKSTSTPTPPLETHARCGLAVWHSVTLTPLPRSRERGLKVKLMVISVDFWVAAVVGLFDWDSDELGLTLWLATLERVVESLPATWSRAGKTIVGYIAVHLTKKSTQPQTITYFTYHICLIKLAELTLVKYFGFFFSTTTNHTLTTHDYIFGVFKRAGARKRSPKFSIPATQFLASAREHSLCWTSFSW